MGFQPDSGHYVQDVFRTELSCETAPAQFRYFSGGVYKIGPRLYNSENEARTGLSREETCSGAVFRMEGGAV